MKIKNKADLAILFFIFSFVLSFQVNSEEPTASKTNIPKEAKADYSKVQLTKRKLPEGADECLNCHTRKNKKFYKPERNPERTHEHIKNLHGKRELSCNSCHDINNYNFLIKTPTNPADFSNSSPVCAHCHYERYREWKRGLHGKLLGGWLAPTEKLHCIDCHDPHSVSYPPVEALPPAYQSPFVIPHPQDEKDIPQPAKAGAKTER